MPKNKTMKTTQQKIIEIDIKARKLAQFNHQVVGEKSDYYITLEQLEKIIVSIFSKELAPVQQREKKKENPTQPEGNKREEWKDEFIKWFFVDRFQELPFESALELQGEIIDFIDRQIQKGGEKERERIIKEIEYLVNRAEGENKMIPPKLLRNLFLTPAK